MKTILNGVWDIQDTAGGKGMCHRAQFIIVPHSLGKFTVSRPPCTGASCALWDPKDNQCLDFTNGDTLSRIASLLQVIVDHLPPELP